MRSTFHGLELGKRGVIAQQVALNTTGHNITNANTPGYSRQVAQMVAARPLEYPSVTNSTSPGQLGMGVEVNAIQRIRDIYFDVEYRNQNSLMNESKVISETLGNIEGVVNEPSNNGLAKNITEFWKAWQTLSKNPSTEDLAARSAVVQQAMAMADSFNSMANQFATMGNNITERINVKVSEANSYVTEISDLTKQIKHIESGGDNANDLRDKRDYLVDQLSKLGNVKVTETSQTYQITFGTKQVIDDLNSDSIVQADVAGVTSGEIFGYVQSRDTFIAEYTKQIDLMANTLATGKIEVTLPAGSILPKGMTPPAGAKMDPANPRKLAADAKVTVDGLNGLHRLGYTLEDPATNGKDFFVTSDGSGKFTAENIRVNPDIAKDLKKIAASLRIETVSKPPAAPTDKVVQSNGDLALLIGGLAEKTFDFGGTALTASSTYGGYYEAVMSQLGVQTDHAKKMLENGELLTDHADSLRQSISGVSPDEETANLIKFQHAYNASARVITVVDEMLDKLINGTGVVGR
ncbi:MULTISPECIES: flagellar hook-associated protein FlgK [Paenibacillus]|uniref:flagellar hook-associated protein FlgK n=1 Tax=Paenibacillus TaxID=44249 RepID=UPI00020D6E1B|nr:MULTISPECIES: flagellar hook-associated protein FlgK [Paenibacillus]EGL13559.1 flagellar hook-associated protein FlgK [Paenibacillus sp. HGF7]EPD86242.1 flagellar hook-associated protein FlgK [Paenibacillus sp. HGH0039]MBV6716787.1 flagellar hook-associated protein FlgK [Paenibacillus chitinolyticus]